MNNTDRMRHLIDLAKGAEKKTPETISESTNPIKAFARWGKLNEGWEGEPASEESRINVYQDTDPLGTGQWFWTRAVNGHIVDRGSAPTEEEAYQAARGMGESVTTSKYALGLKEEEVHDEDIEEDVRQIIATSIREGNTSGKGMVEGDVNYYWELSVPDAAQFDHIMGGPAEEGGMEDEMDEDFVTEYIANQVESGFREGHYPTWSIKINMWRNVAEDMLVKPELNEGETVHLLRMRGGAECGAECDENHCSPEINDVTCPACIAGHDDFLRKHYPDSDLDEMFAEVHEEDTAEDEDDDVTTATGPAYWASYLVNGDDSGLTPEEKAAADAWIAKLGDYSVVGIASDEEGESQEPRFTWHYDLHSGTDTRGGDVVDYVIHKIRRRPAKEVTEDEGGHGIHVDYVFDIDDIPEEYREECIRDCSASGDVSESVDYWRRVLNFTVNRDRAIDCLAGYGSWDREELAEMDDDEIANKILWLACCNFAEWDGDETGNSASGSPQFVLE
jgi:hypothetical protein